MNPFRLPTNLAEAARRDRDEARAVWLTSLPTSVTQLALDWSLDVGAPFEPGGQTAWVAPVGRDGRDDLVLKVAWRRHTESEHEAEGLEVWAGNGAIRLHSAKVFGETVALLIERCVPGTALTAQPEPEQDRMIAAVLSRLWKEPPPGHGFRPLHHMCDMWADEFELETVNQPVDLDPGLVRDAVALFRALPRDTDQHDVLLCTDLHAGNVLASEREPWLMIDPKPYVGDAHYDVVQHLLNCEERLRADPLGQARRLADLTDLNADRLRMWLFARCVQESPGRPALLDIARRLAPK